MTPHLGAARQILVGHRFFEPAEIEFLERPSEPYRLFHPAGLVGVGEQFDIGADGVAQRAHALDILGDGRLAKADFHRAESGVDKFGGLRQAFVDRL